MVSSSGDKPTLATLSTLATLATLAALAALAVASINAETGRMPRDTNETTMFEGSKKEWKSLNIPN